MPPLWRRAATAVALSAACAAGGALAAAPAQALPAQSATVTAVSEDGDPVGLGSSVAYDTADGDSVDVTSNAGATGGPASWVTVSAAGGVTAASFSAPSGQFLLPGTYPDAVKYAVAAGTPGLSVSRFFQECIELTGSFTVTAAVYGTGGYVQTFHATYEQRCVGVEAALRGEIRIDNPPQPPPLALTAVIRANGTVSTVTGRAVVKGSVSCTVPTTVTVAGTVTQVVRRTVVVGSYYFQQACTPGAAVPWKVTVTPGSQYAFKPGAAEVYVEMYGNDPISGVPARAEKAKTVTLVAA
jgi:hypothetical protein